MARAVVTTLAPPRLSRFIMVSPIPYVPPITSTRLPLNSSAMNVKLLFVIVVVGLRIDALNTPFQKYGYVFLYV